MHRLKTIAKPVSWLVLAFFLAAVSPGYALAALMSTEDSLESAVGSKARHSLQRMLARDEVRAQLERWGLDPAEAQERIEALTDTEAVQMARQIENLPAGGNGVGAVIGAVLIVFLVLLFTDIAGFTNVFPFTKKNAI